MNPKVDFYFDKNEKWQKELEKMRTIPLACGLDEKLKWGCPCYTHNESNVVLIHVSKTTAHFYFSKALCSMILLVYWCSKQKTYRRQGRYVLPM